MSVWKKIENIRKVYFLKLLIKLPLHQERTQISKAKFYRISLSPEQPEPGQTTPTREKAGCKRAPSWGKRE